MTRSPIPCRAGVAAAAAVVLLAACGGDDGDSGDATGTASAAATTTAGSATASGEEDFCAQAAGLDERVDEALSGVGDDDPSVTDAFRQTAEELRAVEAPEPIAADWEALAGGLDRMADAFADLDVTDPDSLAALEDVEGQLSTAGDNVDAYLRDECGIGD
ncbi:hypothetical protein JOD57_004781 [Geodermatophilus bullaregiensis]|uniref:hypothetical protein n=1 Tax=Geodermatophilus bullaregiensis TaxID=1564160 RepID=UPI00195BA610|nr:hypothetical protein [Geodermatophilus bullaregiensis]MBM7808944.1 hypothetical protein [Geodermatophilus bullaregiensis]